MMGGHMGPPLRRKCTGHVGSAEPGAKVELHQPQFLQTQGPVARREFRPATQFWPGGIFLAAQGGTPGKGGGGGGPGGARSPLPEPSPSVFWFLFHVEKELAHQGETLQNGAPSRRALQSKQKPKERRGSSNEIRSFIAPSSGPFGATFPYPLCRCATSPLDKGSRPPGGRLLEGEHLSSAGGRLKKSRLQNPRGQK